jgi:hypothetical protein
MSTTSTPRNPEVRICNPEGGCGWTSAKRALKLIAKRRARPRPDLGANVIEIIVAAEVVDRSGHKSVNLEIIISSHGTREFSTFGRYPMFPREFMRARFAPALQAFS